MAVRRWLSPVADGLALLCELGLLTVLAIAGWGLAGATAPRLLLAVLLPGLAAVLWSVWMAPRSPRRLPDPGRLVAQVLLFAVAGVLAAAAGHGTLGLVFAVAASAVFGLTRLTGGVTGGPAGSSP